MSELFTGTVILIIANAISKILGAVFKIPLTYLLHEEGMAIMNTALSVYTMLLSLVISGFPLAISTLTAKHYALKNHSYMKKLSYASMLLLSAIGLFVSLILFFGAEFFAYAMKDPKATLAIRVISPSVFAVAVGTVCKGYFQGSVNMLPTGLSQVIESLVRLFAGYGLAYIFIRRGVQFAASGAVLGITIGEIVATFILLSMFLYSIKKVPSGGINPGKKQAISDIFSIAVPMFLCSSFISALHMVDTAVIRNCLLKICFTPKTASEFLAYYSRFTDCFSNITHTLRPDIAGARWLYGAYSGYALTIFNLPTGIIGSLGVSILPIITGNLASGNLKSVTKTTSLALKVTTAIAFPFAFGMAFFSREVLSLLFNNTASAPMLVLLAPCLIFVAISNLFISILHSAGYIKEPSLFTALGILLKILFNFMLIPLPQINICGAPISSSVAYLVVMCFCAVFIKKKLDVRFYVKDSVIKPFFLSALMILFMKLTIAPFKNLFGESIGFLSCLGAGALFYLLITILLFKK